MNTLFFLALYSSSIPFSGLSSSIKRSKYESHMLFIAWGRIALMASSLSEAASACTRQFGFFNVFNNILKWGCKRGLIEPELSKFSASISAGVMRAFSISKLSRSNSRQPAAFHVTQWASRSSTCFNKSGKPSRVCLRASSQVPFNALNSDRTGSGCLEMAPPASRLLEPSCSNAWKAIMTCVRNCSLKPGSSNCTARARARGACLKGAGSGCVQGCRALS
mmetsp:Transcript_87773/g.220952  ORF Transcript_87773/g.220952 Transcript_87773/m.220952 type:complete len:221 (+) Transcript_87773:220-882(+)